MDCRFPHLWSAFLTFASSCPFRKARALISLPSPSSFVSNGTGTGTSVSMGDMLAMRRVSPRDDVRLASVCAFV